MENEKELLQNSPLGAAIATSLSGRFSLFSLLAYIYHVCTYFTLLVLALKQIA